MFPSDTILGQGVSFAASVIPATAPWHAPLLLIAHHQNRDIELVPHRIDRVAEDQILDPAMSMSAHHEQIGLYFARIGDDLPARIRPMADARFDLNFHFSER